MHSYLNFLNLLYQCGFVYLISFYFPHNVTNGVYRVYKNHPWSGKSHHFTNLPTHIVLITMYGTRLTSRFFLSKRTLFEPEHRIVSQIQTLITQTATRFVSRFTIDAYHLVDNLLLSFIHHIPLQKSCKSTLF